MIQTVRSSQTDKGEYHPDPEVHQAYHFFFEKYQETTTRLRDIMHDITQHVTQENFIYENN